MADGVVASATRRPSPRWWSRPWVGLVALLVVLGTALAVGSGVGTGANLTVTQRAAQLDAQIRCPSCEDLSVAQSSASAAVAVRHEVVRLMNRGASDQQVKDALVAQYGSTILLSPPASGAASLVWVLPIVAGALALSALVVLFWRRSRALRRLRRAAP